MARLTSEEAGYRALAEQAREAAEVAMRDLLSFGNLNPANTKWKGWRDAGWLVHGDPAVDSSNTSDPNWRLRELHEITQGQLLDAVSGTFSLTALTAIRGLWGYTPLGGVLSYPPQRDLDQYLLWALLHGLAGQKHFRRCQRPQCLRFYIGRITSKYCQPACRDSDKSDRRRRQNREHGRAYAAKNFGTKGSGRARRRP
jgi:hypothetical protein